MILVPQMDSLVIEKDSETEWMQVERDREVEGSRQIEAEDSLRSKRTTRDPSGPRQT